MNLVTCKAKGIPLAVVALVMLEQDGDGFRQGFHRLQDLSPDRDVIPHGLELFRSQPSGLVQNRDGSADLSHIMQEAAPGQGVDLVVGNTQLPSYLTGEGRHPLRVSRRPGRFRVYVSGQGDEDPPIEAVQFIDESRIGQGDSHLIGELAGVSVVVLGVVGVFPEAQGYDS